MGRNEEIWAGQSVNKAFDLMKDIRPLQELKLHMHRDNKEYHAKLVNEWLDETFDLAEIIFRKGLQKKFLEWGNK